jgi:PBSX family phage terminase large subunit
MSIAPSEKLLFAPLVGKGALSCRYADARMNIWDGAVRSSKTIASIVAWLDYCAHGPAGELAMVGKTLDTIKRNVINVMQQMLGTRCRYNQGTRELFIGKRKIYVIGANDAKAEPKIRGMTLAGVYVDEITLVPEAFFRMLGTRLSIPGAKMFGTTNPDNPQHWLKKDYLDKAKLHLDRDGRVTRYQGPARLDLHRFTFHLGDNPHLDAAYLANLKLEYFGLWRKRFIDGEWVMAEGVVYDMWNPVRHVVGQMPPMERQLCVGIDYGTRNVFAALRIGLARRKLWVLDQWRWDSQKMRRQYTSAEYSDRIQRWLRKTGGSPEWIYVDPSAADFRLQLFNDGVPGVQAADNDVIGGIRTVASLLSTDKLAVSPLCTGLLDTFPGYVWDEKAALVGVDKPVKVNDHDLDALRYGVYSAQWLWRPALGQLAGKT